MFCLTDIPRRGYILQAIGGGGEAEIDYLLIGLEWGCIRYTRIKKRKGLEPLNRLFSSPWVVGYMLV